MRSCPYFVPGVPHGDESDDLQTLEKLVRDLRAYAEGRPPSATDLEAAPSIDDWTPVPEHASIRFAGQILGHPDVRPGLGVTSRVYAIDRRHRWIRTYSRLWRLGPPLAIPGRDRS